jgi:hypothetical protein
MLRVSAGTENIKDINSPPLVPSMDSGQALSLACPESSRRVEGLLGVFQQPGRSLEPGGVCL